MIAALLLAAAALGAGARLEAEPSSVHIGEPFVITVVVEHETGANVKLPDPSTLPLSFTLVADLGLRRELGANGLTTTRARWRVMALEGGELDLPALDIAVESGGVNQLVRAVGPKLSVAHALKEGEDAPRAARGFRDAPHVTTAASKLTWIALGIAGLVAVFVARRILRRKRIPAPVPVLGTAARLDELERRVNAEPERARDHVFALTTLLRQALDEHAGEDRAALSDEDWARATAVDSRVPVPVGKIVAKLLAEAERVKYAGETPSMLGVRDSLAQAKAALAALPAQERTAA